jgi:hypothetical protein
MRHKIEHSWEDMGSDTYRAMVIGGWIVLHLSPGAKTGAKSGTESLVFVPDRCHEWIHLSKLAASSDDNAKL